MACSEIQADYTLSKTFSSQIGFPRRLRPTFSMAMNFPISLIFPAHYFFIHFLSRLFRKPVLQIYIYIRMCTAELTTN